MAFHRPFLWAISSIVLFSLLVLLGWDSLGCIAGLYTRNQAELAVGEPTSGVKLSKGTAPPAPWSRGGEILSKNGTSAGAAPPSDNNIPICNGGHVRHVDVGRVSADQPNVSFVESLVPTLSELSEEAWASAAVPPGLLYFLEIRTAKLISLAQLIRADSSLSQDDLDLLMQRLVVNLHAVTRVGDKLCGEIDTYVYRVATRAAEKVKAGDTAASGDAADENKKHAHFGHDIEDAFLQKRHQAVLKAVEAETLRSLEERNPSWRQAVRVCRSLNSKTEHFMPIINALLNNVTPRML